MILLLLPLLFWIVVFAFIAIRDSNKETNEEYLERLKRKRELWEKEYEEKRSFLYLSRYRKQNSKEEKDSYNELLQRVEWKLKRQEILTRDGFKCTHCGATSNLLVHHTQYRMYNRKFLDPWDYPNSCLVTLCDECHKKAHTNKKIPIIYYNL